MAIEEKETIEHGFHGWSGFSPIIASIKLQLVLEIWISRIQDRIDTMNKMKANLVNPVEKGVLWNSGRTQGRHRALASIRGHRYNPRESVFYC